MHLWLRRRPSAAPERRGDAGPEDDPKLRKAVRAYQRVREAEARLESAREVFYSAILEAREAGVSISALARALGVSRQAVKKIVGRRR